MWNLFAAYLTYAVCRVEDSPVIRTVLIAVLSAGAWLINFGWWF